ncbi:MAG TPA: hypothetical protein VFI46_00275, partial [Jiangellaceae bacterium]|nr:hypothetical protein [Jiangellaceae bacterium]
MPVAFEGLAGDLENDLPPLAGWLRNDVVARWVLAVAWLERGQRSNALIRSARRGITRPGQGGSEDV